MTKVGRLYEEEKIDYANKYANKVRQEDKIALVKKMLDESEDIIKIMKYTELTKDEILKIQEGLNLPDAI